MDRVPYGERLGLALASADGEMFPARAEEGAPAWLREQAVPRPPHAAGLAPEPGEAPPGTERGRSLSLPRSTSREADRAAAGSAGAGAQPGTAARFAEVAVTLPVPGRFHYAIPEPLAPRAQVGARVLVRFGARKVTGVVVRIDAAPPPGIAPIALSDVLDEVPALSPELVELCAWIADYYEAPPGEVIRAALPAGSGVAARSVFALTPAG
ncbi:MAG TPA: hypothetical protein VF516_37690, partial [Kofleriaceae bacterium]